MAALHNSHVLFYTREEWNLRQTVLPFTFEKRGGRVFVRPPLRDSNLRFGDEITEINHQPASALQAKSLATLSGAGNPLYGEPSSLATLSIVSKDTARKLEVRRVKIGDDDAVQFRKLSSGIFLSHFLSLPSGATASAQLRAVWTDATKAEAIVLELRDCSGGWPSASSYVLDSLLGASRAHFRVFDRNGTELPRTQAFAAPTPFTGRVAAHIGSDTQSECEVVAAGPKETGRAVLVGGKTAGAWNGYTESFSLPDDFVLFALPYTKTLSPQNKSYEGTGIEPDKPVENENCGLPFWARQGSGRIRTIDG